MERGLERRSLEELDAVGIDEKNFSSGQSHISVLSDPKGSRVLEVTEGWERASAERLFQSVPADQREKVEAVRHKHERGFPCGDRSQDAARRDRS